MMSYSKSVFFSIAGFCVFVLMATSSCFNRPDKRNNISRVLTDGQEDYSDDEEDRRRDSFRSRAPCDRRDSFSEEISLRELKFVNSNNVGEYLLQGKCTQEDDLIYVTVNGYRTSANPKCDRKRWEITLDLTSVAREDDVVVFELTHNRERICKEVRVAFLGPKNYIPIPPLEDYYDSGFYVMKYEAKLEGKRPHISAVSTDDQKPAGGISHKEALTLCENNGSRYSLLQNSQWQNIARAIEEVDENWSEGRASPSDNNSLNCGVYRGSAREASSDDEDDCAVSSCEEGWDLNRRTHLLPNGERIWDICGNVGEIMKDKYRGNESFDDYVYQLSSVLKKTFGPKKTYRLAEATRRSNSWGLGYAKIDDDHDLIVRGLPGRDAGIFSVDITSDQESRRGYSRDIGFRCVYIP